MILLRLHHDCKTVRAYACTNDLRLKSPGLFVPAPHPAFLLALHDVAVLTKGNTNYGGEYGGAGKDYRVALLAGSGAFLKPNVSYEEAPARTFPGLPSKQKLHHEVSMHA